MTGGSGGAIYLPYLALHHTAWLTQKEVMSTLYAHLKRILTNKVSVQRGNF